MEGVVLLAVILKTLLCDAYDVQRTTNLGAVGGRKIEIFGTTVEEYRGIPYAELPVGELRFRPPVPAKQWEGTINATSRRSGCPQSSRPLVIPAGLEYGEDCLHLNVWTREGTRDAPVLVWIYGGGFTYGSASYDNYTGALIAAKMDVVVASMNYRLGVLGFLSAGSPESPGNMGLLDQNLALKWIKNNIDHFGGDPARITLIGLSAGAMSVHAYMLSPMSRGLFRRAIAMSGVISGSDVTDSLQESMAKGDAVAAIVGCHSENKTIMTHPDEIIGCLRTRSADELVRAASTAAPGKQFSFKPTYHDAFLPENPAVALRSGSFDASVDFLTGVTSDEAGTMFLWKQTTPEILAADIDNINRETLKRALHEKLSSFTKDVPSALLEDGDNHAISNAELRRKAIDYLGNRLFVCPMHTVAAAHASRGGTVYTYVFDHWPARRVPLTWAGVGHGMDLSYIFGLPLLDRDEVEFNNKDAMVCEKVLAMIGAFAGSPVYQGVAAWPKYTASSPISMLVNNDNDTRITGFRLEQCVI